MELIIRFEQEMKQYKELNEKNILKTLNDLYIYIDLKDYSTIEILKFGDYFLKHYGEKTRELIHETYGDWNCPFLNYYYKLKTLKMDEKIWKQYQQTFNKRISFELCSLKKELLDLMKSYEYGIIHKECIIQEKTIENTQYISVHDKDFLNNHILDMFLKPTFISNGCILSVFVNDHPITKQSNYLIKDGKWNTFDNILEPTSNLRNNQTLLMRQRKY